MSGRLVLASILVATGVSVGCGSVRRAYPGPPREPTEIAVLAVERGRILRIDGVARSGERFELLPGRHQVFSRFRLRGDDLGPGVGSEFAVDLICEVTFTAKAGRTYRLQTVRIEGDRKGGSTRYHYGAELQDLLADYTRMKLAECEWR